MRRTIGMVALTLSLAVATTSAAQAAVMDSVTNGLASSAAVPPLVVSPPTTTSAIALNQWYTFTFGGVGSGFANGSGASELGINPASTAAPDPAWSFILPSAGGTLIVTDGFSSGDQFNITDAGTSLGNTSVPTFGAYCGNDIGACLFNTSISHGSFSLAAGAHSIDGTAIASPFDGGAAFFEVVSSTTPVPEPASLALLGFGLLGLSIVRGRRRA